MPEFTLLFTGITASYNQTTIEAETAGEAMRLLEKNPGDFEWIEVACPIVCYVKNIKIAD